MAVPLTNLVTRAKQGVNVPGGSFIEAETDHWVEALAYAFWTAKTRGFFANYRINGAYEIVNVADPGTDLPELEQHIIVLMCAYVTLENKLLEMPLTVRGKAGPAEGEINRSAQVLSALLKARREDLKAVKDELSSQGHGTRAYVIDAFLNANDRLGAGESVWVT